MAGASQLLRAAPSCKSKLDEEKSNHAGLALQNGFGLAFLHSLLRVVEGTAKQDREECNNMIHLLLPVSYWPLIMIGQSGSVLVSGIFCSPSPICSSSFGFMGGVGKK
jgi:hypothetical protein